MHTASPQRRKTAATRPTSCEVGRGSGGRLKEENYGI